MIMVSGNICIEPYSLLMALNSDKVKLPGVRQSKIVVKYDREGNKKLKKVCGQCFPSFTASSRNIAPFMLLAAFRTSKRYPWDLASPMP